eukprot:2656666-Rhodomonas_salina.2
MSDAVSMTHVQYRTNTLYAMSSSHILYLPTHNLCHVRFTQTVPAYALSIDIHIPSAMSRTDPAYHATSTLSVVLTSRTVLHAKYPIPDTNLAFSATETDLAYCAANAVRHLSSY